MRTKKEATELIDELKEWLIYNYDIAPFPRREITKYIFRSDDESRGAIKALTWFLEHKPKKKKNETSHKLKDYGLPENAGIKKN